MRPGGDSWLTNFLDVLCSFSVKKFDNYVFGLTLTSGLKRCPRKYEVLLQSPESDLLISWNPQKPLVKNHHRHPTFQNCCHFRVVKLSFTHKTKPGSKQVQGRSSFSSLSLKVRRGFPTVLETRRGFSSRRWIFMIGLKRCLAKFPVTDREWREV